MFRFSCAVLAFMALVSNGAAMKVLKGQEEATLKAKVKSKVRSFVKFGTGVQAAGPQHLVRICNAYPNRQAMTIQLNKIQISEQPLAYRTCQQFQMELKAPDRMDFHLGETYAGTFSIHQMPPAESVLLLVIYRHAVDTNAVSFQSHVFGHLENAQLAIIDTYQGKEKSKPVVTEENDQANRIEQLRFDAVVAVRPGQYEVALLDPVTNEAKTSDKFYAVPGETYCAIRTGVDSTDGRKYAEEIMVFPQNSSAAILRPFAVLLFALAFNLL
eukprot:TRINITY_DN67315_c0_g1_i1.p1 TRINITY_DN67315_c0_g1~~TRINITY_DN67315_c0_g1_i1.p1  ORF type:complete len:271 (+),score=63.22 TRINITY_DN67315_c0_g1_i1:111-923(+)